jgi:hypothetical protein
MAKMNKSAINFGALKNIMKIGGVYLGTGSVKFEKKSRASCHAILKDSLSTPRVVNQIYENHKNIL